MEGSFGYPFLLIEMKCYLALVLVIALVGCASIHKSWQMTKIVMEDADSETLNILLKDTVTYTFDKDGTYSYRIGGQNGGGIFLYDRKNDNLLTVEEGVSDKYKVDLSKKELIISIDGDSMTLVPKH